MKYTLRVIHMKRIKADWKKITGTILLITLILSIIYAVFHIITSPSNPTGGFYKKLRNIMCII